jgi:uncharacterized protein (DUF488 family)
LVGRNLILLNRSLLTHFGEGIDLVVQIISLGYECRSIDEIVGLLEDCGVEKLIDVREAPRSRKKGFSKKALAAATEAAGIQHSHIRAAGNPYRKEKKNIELCLQLYRRHLHTNPDICDIVAAELSDQPTAILCYEREHSHCHRSVLLDELKRKGFVSEVVKVE